MQRKFFVVDWLLKTKGKAAKYEVGEHGDVEDLDREC